MHANSIAQLTTVMTAWTGLQNTVAWMILVLGCAAVLGGTWMLVDWIISNFRARVFSVSQQPPQPRSIVPPPFSLPASKGLSADTIDRARRQQLDAITSETRRAS
jgi:hypothetical protein